MLYMDAVLGHSRAEHENGKACFVFIKTSYTSTGEPVLLPHSKMLRPALCPVVSSPRQLAIHSAG